MLLRDAHALVSNRAETRSVGNALSPRTTQRRRCRGIGGARPFGMFASLKSLRSRVAPTPDGTFQLSTTTPKEKYLSLTLGVTSNALATASGRTKFTGTPVFCVYREKTQFPDAIYCQIDCVANSPPLYLRRTGSAQFCVRWLFRSWAFRQHIVELRRGFAPFPRTCRALSDIRGFWGLQIISGIFGCPLSLLCSRKVYRRNFLALIGPSDQLARNRLIFTQVRINQMTQAALLRELTHLATRHVMLRIVAAQSWRPFMSARKSSQQRYLLRLRLLDPEVFLPPTPAQLFCAFTPVECAAICGFLRR